jgi:probable phosphoglycerate mutase
MNLILIRHGMTDWNSQKRVQGRIDQPLSTEGRRQLDELAIPHALSDYHWYCSPLVRAVDTARHLNIENFRIESRLIEMNWGEWEGQVLKPLRKQLGDVMRDNESRGLDFCPPAGESPRQVQRRLQLWLDEISALGTDCAVIAHKGIIRCIYSMACGWDMVGETPVDFAWDVAHCFELAANGSLGNSYQTMSLSAD